MSSGCAAVFYSLFQARRRGDAREADGRAPDTYKWPTMSAHSASEGIAKIKQARTSWREKCSSPPPAKPTVMLALIKLLDFCFRSTFVLAHTHSRCLPAKISARFSRRRSFRLLV